MRLNVRYMPRSLQQGTVIKEAHPFGQGRGLMPAPPAKASVAQNAERVY